MYNRLPTKANAVAIAISVMSACPFMQWSKQFEMTVHAPMDAMPAAWLCMLAMIVLDSVWIAVLLWLQSQRQRHYQI
jgi:hypothetical protein